VRFGRSLPTRRVPGTTSRDALAADQTEDPALLALVPVVLVPLVLEGPALPWRPGLGDVDQGLPAVRGVSNDLPVLVDHLPGDRRLAGDTPPPATGADLGGDARLVVGLVRVLVDVDSDREVLGRLGHRPLEVDARGARAGQRQQQDQSTSGDRETSTPPRSWPESRAGGRAGRDAATTTDRPRARGTPRPPSCTRTGRVGSSRAGRRRARPRDPSLRTAVPPTPVRQRRLPRRAPVGARAGAPTRTGGHAGSSRPRCRAGHRGRTHPPFGRWVRVSRRVCVRPGVTAPERIRYLARCRDRHRPATTAAWW
jgi:hypothetical protein